MDDVAAKQVVGGLAEVLIELGAELRRANSAGEDTVRLSGADVELMVSLEANAGGGVKFWVVNADVGSTYTRGAKITVHLYPGSEDYAVGK